MAAHGISREEFVVAAVEHDDVKAAQRYFAQEDVVAEVDRVNNFFRGLETPLEFLEEGPADPWYFTQPPGDYFRDVGPRSLIFETAMQKDNGALIQWLFAPAQMTVMGVTLAALVPFVGKLAADLNHTETLDVLLTSDVFTTMLTEDQRRSLLQDTLEVAVERDHEQVVDILVAHGAHVNLLPTSWQREADMLSLCAFMGSCCCIEVLARNGIFTIGTDVLYEASMANNNESVRQLLKFGVDWGNKAGTLTPLHVAAERRDSDLVLLLLRQAFADVDMVDGDGATAIELASRVQKDNDTTIEILRRFGATVG